MRSTTVSFFSAAAVGYTVFYIFSVAEYLELTRRRLTAALASPCSMGFEEAKLIYFLQYACTGAPCPCLFFFATGCPWPLSSGLRNAYYHTSGSLLVLVIESAGAICRNAQASSTADLRDVISMPWQSLRVFSLACLNRLVARRHPKTTVCYTLKLPVVNLLLPGRSRSVPFVVNITELP
jgi:hypothetical protein